MDKILTLFIILVFLSSCSSASVTNAPEPQRDILYAVRDSVELRADWHPAAKTALTTKGETPACVVIHGGGWYKGDKSDMESISRRLAENGIAVMNINYRLSPAYRFPAPVLDTKDAIRWLKANSKELFVDPKRVCVFGYSAGAHLALMAGFTQPGDALDDTTPPTAKILKYKSDSEVLSKLPKDLSVRVVVGGGTPSNLFNGDYNKYYEKFLVVHLRKYLRPIAELRL